MPTRSVRLPARRPSRILPVLGAAALLLGCDGASLGGNGNDNTGVDAATDVDASLCGEGDDEKQPSGKPKIFHGTQDPEICMSPRQTLAVGALLFEYLGWSNGCTGTLINEDTVLTAAHCVTHMGGQTISPSSVRFVLGRNALDPDFIFNVSAVWGHPSYQGDADNDVGLLRLSEPITTAGANALPIPVNRADLGTGFEGEFVQNAGFGGTEVNDDNTWLFWTTEVVTDVRAGEFVVFGGGAPNGSSVCYGDSGGPSFHLFGGDALAVLGTVSWGDPSCMDYDHFARMDDNLDFIEQHAGALDPCVNLGARGLCDADVAIWCDNGTLRQQCCGAIGSGCAANADGDYRCTDTCGGLDFAGECQGTDAVWCDNGQLKRRRCAPCDQICGWAGDALGYYCVDP